MMPYVRQFQASDEVNAHEPSSLRSRTALLVAARDYESARHGSKEIAVHTPQRFLRYCWSETMTVVPSPPGQLRRPSEMWRRCLVGTTINESRRV